MNRIAMVVFSRFPMDTRVRREAEALYTAGFSVDIICLAEKNKPNKELIHGVQVYRIRLEKKRGTKLRYISDYLHFITVSFLKLSFMHLKKRYDIIHVHNMPDILVFSSLFPKLTGSKVILDLHDTMPELFETIFSVHRTNPIITLLTFLEKISIRIADIVITPNISFRDVFISRGCPADKIHIVMNSPDEKIFNNEISVSNIDSKIIKEQFNIMFHGTIVERHGLDTALEAVNKLRLKIPNMALHIFGTSEYIKVLKKRSNQLNLKNAVKFHNLVPIETIVSTIRQIDVGIIPNKIGPFTNLNFPVRIFEYLSMGKPVIVPKTQGISDYFDTDSMIYFESNNSESLSNSILEVYKNPLRTSDIVANGYEVYKKYRWEIQKNELLLIINKLIKQ